MNRKSRSCVCLQLLCCSSNSAFFRCCHDWLLIGVFHVCALSELNTKISVQSVENNNRNLCSEWQPWLSLPFFFCLWSFLFVCLFDVCGFVYSFVCLLAVRLFVPPVVRFLVFSLVIRSLARLSVCLFVPIVCRLLAVGCCWLFAVTGSSTVRRDRRRRSNDPRSGKGYRWRHPGGLAAALEKGTVQL